MLSAVFHLIFTIKRLFLSMYWGKEAEIAIVTYWPGEDLKETTHYCVWCHLALFKWTLHSALCWPFSLRHLEVIARPCCISVGRRTNCEPDLTAARAIIFAPCLMQGVVHWELPAQCYTAHTSVPPTHRSAFSPRLHEVICLDRIKWLLWNPYNNCTYC